LADQFATVAVGNGFRRQPNLCFVEDDMDSVDEEFQHEEVLEDPFQSSVDWNSLLIYATDVNDEYLVEVSSLPYDQEVDKNWDTHHLFDESPKGEVSWLSLEKINYVDFLGIENFDLDLGFGMFEENLIFSDQEVFDHFWEIFMEGKLKKINKGRVKIKLSQIGAKNCRSTIQSCVVVSCKLFIFLFVCY
jgi:hypothetical protein